MIAKTMGSRMIMPPVSKTPITFAVPGVISGWSAGSRLSSGLIAGGQCHRSRRHGRSAGLDRFRNFDVGLCVVHLPAHRAQDDHQQYGGYGSVESSLAGKQLPDSRQSIALPLVERLRFLPGFAPTLQRRSGCGRVALAAHDGNAVRGARPRRVDVRHRRRRAGRDCTRCLLCASAAGNAHRSGRCSESGIA